MAAGWVPVPSPSPCLQPSSAFPEGGVPLCPLSPGAARLPIAAVFIAA